MTTLLILIYIAFISLGLPDSLLGSSWPVMQGDLNAPLSLCGYIFMVTAAGTIVSSLLSNRIISRFGTGKVTAVSVLMTAAGLLGYSLSSEAWMLFLFAIPLGLGGGSVDTALNNFVALHYEAKHMSWLHCFWGLGATTGPVVLSALLSLGFGWRTGYGVMSGIQFALTAVLFLAVPVWKKAVAQQRGGTEERTEFVSNSDALRLPGIWLALLGFIFFCAVETTCGLWAATYLHEMRGLTAELAAIGASLFYGAITFGRLVGGFATAKIAPVKLIRIGQIICLAGAVMVMLPLPAGFGMAGIAVIGFGTSPIYPNMLHETPNRFGARNSQAVVGLQMAFAYIGSTLMPPLFGSIASATTLHLYPYFLFVCTLVMMTACELVTRRTAKR